MAMTLRLSDEQTEALREQADSEGRSMQDVVQTAVASYLHATRVARSAAQGAERYAELLQRLGDA
jgi:hypothetical protein